MPTTQGRRVGSVATRREGMEADHGPGDECQWWQAISVNKSEQPWSCIGRSTGGPGSHAGTGDHKRGVQGYGQHVRTTIRHVGQASFWNAAPEQQKAETETETTQPFGASLGRITRTGIQATLH